MIDGIPVSIFIDAARFAVLIICLLAFAALHIPIRTIIDRTPPVIDLWYGNQQVFGLQGIPQRWVNILGSVTYPETGVARLTYQLNDGRPISVLLGPDKRRLAHQGDFNIEIAVSDLKTGSNRLVLEAYNRIGLSTITTMTVDYYQRPQPLPYSIRWAEVENPLDVVQVVDGKWTCDANGIRPARSGYDRLLAIGDMTWTDYEVTVPLTIHGVNTGGYGTKESGGAGLGVNFHWQGHTDDPVKCNCDGEPRQPHCGWRPKGGSNWYSFKRFKPRKPASDYLTIDVDPSPEPRGSTRTSAIEFQFGHTYIFQARVEMTSEGLLYRLKVWEPAVEQEPAEWTLSRIGIPGDEIKGVLQNGSITLVAHHVDVTFGDIDIIPLNDQTELLDEKANFSVVSE